MKRTILFAVCLVFVASVVLAAAAKPPTVRPDWWPGQKPGKPAPKENVAVGTVAAVSATKIDVQTASGVKSFGVFPKTRVVVQGKKATIADVKVGDPVNVVFRVVNNTAIALRIAVPKPSVAGKITAINANVITINGKKGEFQITVSDSTRIKSHGYAGALADLQVGFGAGAQGTLSGNNMAADAVEFLPAVARGAVTAVDGNTITIKAIRQQTIETLASDKTVVLVRPRVGPNVKGTIADVKVGAPVNIGFKPIKDGPSPLFWIDILTGT